MMSLPIANLDGLARTKRFLAIGCSEGALAGEVG